MSLLWCRNISLVKIILDRVDRVRKKSRLALETVRHYKCSTQRVFGELMAAGRLTTATAVAAFWLTMMAMSPVVRAVTDDMLKIACEDMTPRHPGYKPENENRVPCPYRLVVHAEPVVPGDSVNLTLTSSNGSTPFKGFMIQARDYRGRVLGTFLPSCAGGGNKSHHMITCDDGVEPYVSAVAIPGDEVVLRRNSSKNRARNPPSLFPSPV